MYIVFEGFKPAKLDSENPIWNNNEFRNKRQAEIYAYVWCNKVTWSQASLMAPEMELGVQYDYSSGGLSFGEPIMMSILEVVDE